MKTHTRIAMALATLALAGFVPAVQAQATDDAPPPRKEMRGHRGEKPRSRLQMMTERLNLTDEQAATLKPLFKQEVEQRKAVRNDSTLTAEQRREKLKELRESFQTKVEAVLTPEQKEKWAKDREGMKERRRGGHRPPPPDMKEGDEPPPPPPDDKGCPPPDEEDAQTK